MEIGLRRSAVLTWAIALLAGLACAGLLLLPVAFVLRSGLFLLAFALAIGAWRRCAPLGTLRLERDGNLQFRVAGTDEFVAATLLPGATVHPWLTVFRVRLAAGRVRAVIATVDSLSGEDFRRLRVFLRGRARFNAAAGGA